MQRMLHMKEKKEKKRVWLVQKASFWSTWALFVLFVGVGIVLMYHGNFVTEQYERRKSVEDLTLSNLGEGLYVEGIITSTVGCYESYDLYDYYVIRIGEEKKQCITVLSNTYNSVALEKLPTADYRWQDGMEQVSEAKEGHYICGILTPLKRENINYAYLKSQFGVTTDKEVDRIVSSKYCIKLIKPENISVWGNAGKASLVCGILVLVFVVLPSYGKKVSVKYMEVDEYEERKEMKKRTSESIKHFLENVYDEISLIMVEYSGKIVEIKHETEIRDFLNCFIQASYDKVYDEYVDRNETYNIEFVMKNGDAISGAMNMENVLFWYGGITRIDHASCKKIKNIIRSKGV